MIYITFGKLKKLDLLKREGKGKSRKGREGKVKIHLIPEFIFLSSTYCQSREFTVVVLIVHSRAEPNMKIL